MATLKNEIMRILFYFFISLLFTACNNNQQSSKQQFTIYPEDTIMITFDIDTFNKYKIDRLNSGGLYEHTTKDGIYVRQHETKEEYVEKRVYSDSLYFDLFVFYLNGKLQWKCTYFKYGEFPVGRTIYYDESGNITEIEDNDAPYKFNLDEVLEFLKEKSIDVRTVSISRDQIGDPKFVASEVLKKMHVDTYFWAINISFPGEGYGTRKIVLNAIDGTVLEDEIYGETPE